ncbi:MAG: hypothetical protein U1F08_13485 [Steroidobacteraceae bacterium]
MDEASRLEVPPAIGLMAVVILALALWAMGFSRSCSSDGCIGIVFPGGGAIIALAIQLFVLVPIHAFRRRRSGKALYPSLPVWIAMSVVAFGLPMAFVK